MSNTKKIWVSPCITVHGSVEELTQQNRRQRERRAHRRERRLNPAQPSVS